MTKKFTFIKTITVVLKAMWYLQWLSAAAFISIFFLLIISPENMNMDKFTGFKVEFSKIDLGSHTLADGADYDIQLTNGNGRLHISNHDQNIIYAKVLVALIEVLCYIYIFYMLIKIFSGLKVGDFFAQKNGLLIRKIAFTIIGITAFTELTSYLISVHIVNTYEIAGIQLQSNTDVDFRILFFGLMLLVISTIFIRGAKLKEEQELTI